MKKIAIIIVGLLVIAGISVFVLLPKAFRIELSSKDLQKKLTIEKLTQLGTVPADMLQEKVKNQINTVLKEEQRIPVVDLKDTAEEQQPKMVRVLSKLFLRDVVIVDDTLTIILSLRK